MLKMRAGICCDRIVWAETLNRSVGLVSHPCDLAGLYQAIRPARLALERESNMMGVELVT